MLDAGISAKHKFYFILLNPVLCCGIDTMSRPESDKLCNTVYNPVLQIIETSNSIITKPSLTNPPRVSMQIHHYSKIVFSHRSCICCYLHSFIISSNQHFQHQLGALHIQAAYTTKLICQQLDQKSAIIIKNMQLCNNITHIN